MKGNRLNEWIGWEDQNKEMQFEWGKEEAIRIQLKGDNKGEEEEQCDQMRDLKTCPNVFKSCLKIIHSSFYINWCYSK